MSTVQRELEELRRIREQERLKKEEEQKLLQEQEKRQKKRNSFLSRAAVFQQKKTLTDEELKEQMKKESAKEKFGRKLNRTLQQNPNQNPLATELKLKNQVKNEVWEIVPQEGGLPYYWNKLTNETTYDIPRELQQEQASNNNRAGSVLYIPPPPQVPPPPIPSSKPTDDNNPRESQRYKLPGLGALFSPVVDETTEGSSSDQAIPPPPPPPPAASPAFAPDTLSQPHETEPNQEKDWVVDEANYPWQYVFEGEETPYYWNIETNETTFEMPSGFNHNAIAVSSASSNEVGDPQPGSIEAQLATIMWQQEMDATTGEYQYFNLSTGEVRAERPAGTVIIVIETAEGVEEDWQECQDMEGGQIYYKNMATGAVRVDIPPDGFVVIAEMVTL